MSSRISLFAWKVWVKAGWEAGPVVSPRCEAPGPAPYHARPAPESYFSAPLSFSGSGPGFNPAPAVTSTAAPLHYSPTPYVGYSHSQERQYSPPASPTPSLYHHPSPSPAVYQPYHTTDNSLGTYLI